MSIKLSLPSLLKIPTAPCLVGMHAPTVGQNECRRVAQPAALINPHYTLMFPMGCARWACHGECLIRTARRLRRCWKDLTFNTSFALGVGASEGVVISI